jgi:mRNA-degrading endonuclease RelE of RelBE toxin-antitoxin system
MYSLYIRAEADKIFKKLAKKNPHQLKIIHKKIKEIRANPEREYKFLRKPLQNYNSVHIDGHFILFFKINHKEREVEVCYYDHHDFAYKWKPKNSN